MNKTLWQYYVDKATEITDNALENIKNLEQWKQERQQIKKEFLYWGFVGTVILILVVISFFLIYSYTKNKDKKLQELYKQLKKINNERDIYNLFNNMIIVIIYLALFVLLYQEKPVTVLLALILGLIGIACYYPSNPAFEMLTLSNQYFQALPEQQNIYLAAGESLMAGYTC